MWHVIRHKCPAVCSQGRNTIEVAGHMITHTRQASRHKRQVIGCTNMHARAALELTHKAVPAHCLTGSCWTALQWAARSHPGSGPGQSAQMQGWREGSPASQSCATCRDCRRGLRVCGIVMSMHSSNVAGLGSLGSSGKPTAPSPRPTGEEAGCSHAYSSAAEVK